MTPKHKAIEIISKHFEMILELMDIDKEDLYRKESKIFYVIESISKKSAIFELDLMIELNALNIDYLKEIKSEIENL